MKKKLGRPPVPKKHQKASLLSVRFSEGERKSVEQFAGRDDAKLSDYARGILLATIHVFDDRFILISSRPANPHRARAIAGVHLNDGGMAAYLYDFTRPGEVVRIAPDGSEATLSGSSLPEQIRRLEHLSSES